MKFILLTNITYSYRRFYLAISRILAIAVLEGGQTCVTVDKIGTIFKVQETPEQIFELIKQQEQA